MGIRDNAQKIDTVCSKEVVEIYDLILATFKRINSLLIYVVIGMAIIGFTSWIVKGINYL
jgi:hypothetical protein